MTIAPELHTPIPAPEAPKLPRPRNRLRASDLATVLAALVLLTAVAWTLVPGWFTSHDPLVGDGALKFLPPSAEHWFGTDRAGRDTFARVVHGTRNTVYGAVIGTSIGLVGGTVLGVTAGVLRGVVDAAIMRVVDVLLAVPGFLLALCVVAAFGPGTVHVAIGVGIAAVAPFARVARSEALRVVQLEYVAAQGFPERGRARSCSVMCCRTRPVRSSRSSRPSSAKPS